MRISDRSSDVCSSDLQRLGRILAGLMPDAPEVLGLLALMEIQASRLAARVGPDGALVPLPEQDRARWDQLLIRRGLNALARAEALGGAERSEEHTSELQSLMRISYAVFCLKKKKQ